MGDFVSITATQDLTLVLKVADLAPVLPWSATLPHVDRSQTASLSMSAGQVIELFTAGKSSRESFQGSTVTVAGGAHVQVLTGIACAPVPESMPACGHMEESVLPDQALGTTYVAFPLSDRTGPIGYTLRVHAISNGTAITFDPSDAHSPVTLDQGKVVEIARTALDAPVVVTASHPVAVTEYVNSRGDPSKIDSSPLEVGGPSQLTLVPESQFLTRYLFAASPLHQTSYVYVVAPTGSDVTLDGEPVASSGFTVVGSSGMSWAKRELPQAGNGALHEIKSDQPIGIVVNGFDSYSSYLYAGGLGLGSPGR